MTSEAKFEPAAEGDRPALLGKIGTQEVVSTKAILDAKGPFGAIDALDPDARLRVLIETAQKFRYDNPDAPVRAPELAVNEVLRLRKIEAGLRQELSDLKSRVGRLRDSLFWLQHFEP
jgi:hypothetical protein